uniref:Uncharacterized protein n=1 Tax=Aegilops tauschii subsp. strangulata TaxID=200361 RepID=A0A453HY13_AEGTS
FDWVILNRPCKLVRVPCVSANDVIEHSQKKPCCDFRCPLMFDLQASPLMFDLQAILLADIYLAVDSACILADLWLLLLFFFVHLFLY